MHHPHFTQNWQLCPPNCLLSYGFREDGDARRNKRLINAIHSQHRAVLAECVIRWNLDPSALTSRDWGRRGTQRHQARLRTHSCTCHHTQPSLFQYYGPHDLTREVVIRYSQWEKEASSRLLEGIFTWRGSRLMIPPVPAPECGRVAG